MTEQEREAARLAKYRKYNASRKGQQRHKKYEEAHPERRERGWSPVMLYRGRVKNGNI